MTTAMSTRLRAAVLPAVIHLGLSLLVAFGSALLVWGVWYPPPFDQLSGGAELFLLIVVVDVVCGPVLTFVVYDRLKPRAELVRDISIIGILQLAALLYGLWTVAEARPLYLVHEVERFRVITKADYLGVDVTQAIADLPSALKPRLFSGPVLVGARPPLDPKVRNEVLMEALGGGRDFVQRPEYYVPYDDDYALAVASRAKPLTLFAQRFPDRAGDLQALLKQHSLSPDNALFLPVVHRQDWIAVLDAKGRVLGFVPGDGFSVR
ncbi:MAG: pilus assembly protein [Hydrogenophaga sp.]|nr:pilus assembly protein [Hydrogenophaga sp.]